MDQKKRAEFKFIKRIKSDYAFRTFVSSTLSFLATIAFVGYNIFLSFAYRASWNIGIAVYYVLLVGIRAYILFFEKQLHKSSLADEQKEISRKKLFFVQSIFLFVIDLALIAPITLMVLQKKSINYTKIPAITIAAYTTYKTVIATMNFIKNRNQHNLSIKMLKNINFIDALVSVLSLQYTLIMTFGNGIEGDMLTLCAVSTFAIWALLIAVSLLSLISAIKLKYSPSTVNSSLS